jgi:hypothetical protein
MSSSWEELAKKNNLTYVPGNYSEKEHIQGLYRDYNLRIAHWDFGAEIILNYQKSSLSHRNSQSENDATPSIKISRLLTTPNLINLAQGYLRVEDGGSKIFYHHLETLENPRYNIRHLQRMLDLLCELGDNYRQLLTIGGAVVPVFERQAANQAKLPPFSYQLLTEIGEQTRNQLGHRNIAFLFCPYCLYRIQVQEVDIPGLSENINIRYIGCRGCGQSKDYVKYKKVVALLDSHVTEEQIIRDGTLEVNWLTRRKIFDFDEVRIVQATDEEVERFAVQVGNDTDLLRARAYRKMSCTIGKNCELSQYTIRILGRMFGQLEIMRESPIV